MVGLVVLIGVVCLIGGTAGGWFDGDPEVNEVHKPGDQEKVGSVYIYIFRRNCWFRKFSKQNIFGYLFALIRPIL